ncbi:MAG: butyryl-CoA:acetate CoA-transferase [Intestinimonas sp.]|jgi:butyryl-CoA:acetate CoA-transferase|nr:butyryl-CoA:acetate CoA-transferase [Intestinimonas sp.]
MDYTAEYQKKLTTAEEAVKVVKSGDWVDYGFCATHPVALDKALAKWIEENDLHDVNFRGGVAMFQPEVTKLPDAINRITWNSWHASGIERKLIPQGFGFYIPMRFSELPHYYRKDIRHLNVAMLQVAPMDKHGFFNFGLSATYVTAVCECADIIIVEVNQNMPVCFGGNSASVHLDKVDMVVESDNTPMPELGTSKSSDIDEAVAKLIVPVIPNGACLQLGIGGMPNAVGAMIARSDLKDLGVHTEMYVDSFVDMSLAGKINGRFKNIDKGLQVFGFGAGSQKLYDFVDRNPSVRAASVGYVNNIGTVSSIDNFTSINNAIELDLFGQVVSETVGVRHISGSGGQQDFVMGAYLSHGGKSIICCSSTVKAKDGTVSSRIRPTITPGGVVTVTRTNIHYLCTEYGIVNLKGSSTWQRAEAIISVAHPDFRDELIRNAEKMHIWRRSNRR